MYDFGVTEMLKLDLGHIINNSLLFGMVGGAKIIATGIREISRIIVTVMPTISFFFLSEKIKNNIKLM